jgi:hypothetical protein
MAGQFVMGISNHGPDTEGNILEPIIMLHVFLQKRYFARNALTLRQNQICHLRTENLHNLEGLT